LKALETSSPKKAWKNVKTLIDKNIPVGLKLDCYYLDYFKEKFHFAAHYVAIFGYDEDSAYLVDTTPTGSQAKTSLKSLALARSAKGPMSSKNLYYTISKPSKVAELKEVIGKVIGKNAKDYLNPPIKNIGYKGIEKAGVEIPKWFKKNKNAPEFIKVMAMLMEKAGTGGALFRNIYRDFLKECLAITPSKELEEGHKRFVEIAEMWTTVAKSFEKAEEKSLIEACNVLFELSQKEKKAMEILAKIKT